MLGKVLCWVLLGLLIFIFWQKKRVAQVKREESERKVPESKKMVQCPVCGVHFVEVDGVWVNGTMYCSHECAEKAKGSTE